MNWPFEITFPVHEEFDWILDANGRLIMAQHLAEGANALHAEVERLRETQRKLAVIAAFFSKTDIMLHLSRRSGMKSLCDAYADPDVRAAIKEASDDEN